MKFGVWAVGLSACGHSAVGLRAQISPVSRVVELLQGLATQAETDGQKEQKLYEAYVCWAQTVIGTKTTSIEANNAQIKELATRIRDLDGGRIELTSERQDLDKNIKALRQDVESMEAQRNRENAEYTAADQEMTVSITALLEAIDVLKIGTTVTQSSLVQANSQNLEGFKQRVEEATTLQHAVELGDRFLSQGDALFLRRVLTGEVPKVDWKKLNRKATFKTSYKHRSAKIQDVLNKMLITFESNKQDAFDKEEKSLVDYEKLSTAKKGLLSEAENALTVMKTENGAKTLDRGAAVALKNDLEGQNSRDVGFLADTKTALGTKKTEWKTRQALRMNEVAAITKAVSILSSDDNKDTFKKSFASQMKSFLQINSDVSSAALKVLKKTAHRVGDYRLVSLVSVPLHNDMTAVLGAIDGMVTLLQGQETEDLKRKEACEVERATETRVAINSARKIDEQTDAIGALDSRIKEIQEAVADNTMEIYALNKSVLEAKGNRDDAKKVWQEGKGHDEAAVQLVTDARSVLKKFYEDNSLMAVPTANFLQDPGLAPVAPPATWEGGYAGKTEESLGILAILDMIKEDIEKDLNKAKADEDADKAAYQKFKDTTIAQRDALASVNTDLNNEMSDKLTDRSDATTLRGGEGRKLDGSLKNIAAANPSCDYFTINYETRLKNRQIEIDGLLEAKAILNGGKFNRVDKNREIKPGDAFLQRK